MLGQHGLNRRTATHTEHLPVKFYQSPFSSWLLGAVPGAVSRLPVTDKTLYLTFDDGPHPDTTPELVGLLNAHGASATHFLLGQRVQDWPDGVRHLLENGQHIGNHGWDHTDAWQAGVFGFRDEIRSAKRTAKLLRQFTNERSLWYRPPYGHLHPLAARRLNQQFKIALWSIMPGDFDPQIAAHDVARLALQQAAPGKILVLHDSPKAWPCLQEALPTILTKLTERGYSLRHLP